MVKGIKHWCIGKNIDMKNLMDGHLVVTFVNAFCLQYFMLYGMT